MSRSPSAVQRRLVAQLRSPSGLRQAMLATEVLAPPLALRGRRRSRTVPDRPPTTAGRPDGVPDTGASSGTG